MKDKDMKDRDMKYKDTKDKDNRDVKDKDTKDKDMKDKDIKDKDMKDKDKKHKDIKDKDMKGNEMSCFENRELSWLKFNERVLEEAADPKVPTCERLTFLSIFQSNLDEFFMVRVGSLHDQMLLSKEIRENKTQMTSKEQMEAIFKRVRELGKAKDQIYEELMLLLEKEEIQMVKVKELTTGEIDYLERYFEQEIMPLLSTMVVGKKQPFPFLKNNEIYAAAVLETKTDREKFGIVPCSSEVFGRLTAIPGRAGSFLLVEELILHFLPKVFNKYRVSAKSLIRITRNADIDADSIFDEDLDYREHMAEVVKLRRRLCPVRLELSRELDHKMTAKLCEHLLLKKEQVFVSQSPIDLSFVFQIQDQLRMKSELFFEKRIPQKSPAVDEKRPVIDQILEHDMLLSYPYESIRPFIMMLNQAAEDPYVVSIKMTLYRLAKHSEVIGALVEAAENGKQVDVLVELKARFDEENNIEWSRRLEEAGCHVIYGVDGLKVHSKLCLITRKREGQIEYITQVGTGNYNEKTARLYTDLSLMTADNRIGIEAAGVFQALAMGEVVESAEHLLIAPKCLQNKVLEMMDEEIRAAKNNEQAYIGLKLNSLTDKKIIDKLIEASRAGVKIEMIVRGICCLRSRIPGQTDQIKIISIVGRYLEHSRIYIFGDRERAKIYIASADFMTRNTLRRVEVAVPIYDTHLKVRIHEMFITMLNDNVKAREQMEDGSYQKVAASEVALDSQKLFYQVAYQHTNKQ
ncbi:polyphosphate kinase 1 [Robinsoniella sp. KNHs210]|uniref:polyphosphate kinase 1 n=1 Tax=Robinsoniella sp. KNHs210 TaxID=1469950 RepID=UPI000B1EAFDC|nr:polyphosphate kinase 1 [Robinsoniella sp. KNHs210]